MMGGFKLGAALSGAAMMWAATAAAATLYDSGTPPDPNLPGVGAALDETQWFAGALRAGHDGVVVSGFEGYIKGDGTLTLAVREFDPMSLLPGDEIFSQQLAVDLDDYGWAGLDGLDISLSGGLYWFSFEVRPDDDFHRGGIPTFVPNPTRWSIHRPVFGWDFIEPGSLGFTLRVSGEGTLSVASAPEPATWALMIAGFGLMGATLRRRRPALA